MDFADLEQLELEWLARHPELRNDDPACYGWEPYQLREFARLLELAIPEAPEASFLEVGSGIGTKCEYARRCGLSVLGVELQAPYAEVAAALGVPTLLMDARDFTGYGSFGIVYVNCPLRDDAREAALEAHVRREMQSGSVLIQANDCGPPQGWRTVLEEQSAFRGVWVKP